MSNIVDNLSNEQKGKSDLSTEMKKTVLDNQTDKVVSDNSKKFVVDNSKPITYIGFNQSNSYFTVIIGKEFKVFSFNPYKEVLSHKFDNEIKHVEMLFKSNIYAIIFQNDPTKVYLWDCNIKKMIVELTYRSEVLGIKMNREKLLIVIDKLIYVYAMTNITLINQIDTGYIPDANYNNLVLLHHDSTKPTTIVSPSKNTGALNINTFNKDNSANISNIEITAHKNDLEYVAIDNDATMIATASTKGTLLRVYGFMSTELLYEFRRGIDPAKINNICFSADSKYIVASSNKGTIHVYSLEANNEGKPNSNTISYFSQVKSILPDYYSSVWSYKQIKIPNLNEKEFKITFGGTNDKLYVVTYSGRMYILDINKDYTSEGVTFEYKAFY